MWQIYRNIIQENIRNNYIARCQPHQNNNNGQHRIACSQLYNGFRIVETYLYIKFWYMSLTKKKKKQFGKMIDGFYLCCASTLLIMSGDYLVKKQLRKECTKHETMERYYGNNDRSLKLSKLIFKCGEGL